jgi:photosystem II stability/assembly factor-like uncharacterized protein
MKNLLYIAFTLFLYLLIPDANSQSVSKWDNAPTEIKKKNSFKRLEWFYRPRMNEQDVFPGAFIEKQKAVEYAKMLSQTLKTDTLSQWKNLGPVGIDFSADGMVPHWGVVSGRVRGLAVHPTNPDIVYAGAASGGVWKTTDGGQTWIDKSGGLNLLTFGAIAIDPSIPDVVFAGTGEYHWILTERFYSGDGMYKSTNGGDSWEKVNAEFGSVTHFSDLIISPHNPNVMMASIAKNLQGSTPNEGIWRSADGGQHWTCVLSGEGMYDLSFHPSDANIVFAARGNEQSQAGFLLSTDGGLSFTQSNTGLPATNHIGRIQFDVSVSNPSVLYAVIFDQAPLPGRFPTSAYKSVNGGVSWFQISDGINLCPFSDQGFYDLCIVVNPSNPDHVFLGNVEFSKSIDGETFSSIRNPAAPGGGSDPFDSYTHLDHHIIRFAPSDPSVMYVGCDGGVFKSTDSGTTFQAVNTGIYSIQSYRVASHNTNPDILYSGAQDNGFISTQDRGATPFKLELLGDGTECFMDYSNPDIIFFATIGGYFGRSSNGGQSWDLLVDPITLNDSSAFLCPYWQHPSNPDIIYGCLKQKLYKSTDKGLSWEYTTNSPIAGSAIYAAAQSPINTNNIMVAARNGALSLVCSSDGGTNWQNITGNLGTLSGGNFMRLQADPFDGNTFYLLKNAYSGAVVVKTTDFGTTWTDISSDLPKVPVNDIFIDGDNAGVIYLGNDFGVYRTTNNGGNWERMNNGMPFVPMLDFNLFSFDNTRLLRVATYGRGVFELDLEGFTSVNEAISGAATIQAWPNPASDVLWVEILATLPDTYTLAIVSMSGMEVASKTLFNSGAKFRTSMDISQLKPGSYQLVLKGGHLLKTCKVMIVNVSIY